MNIRKTKPLWDKSAVKPYAKANAIDGAVPDEVKEERWHRFMAVQAEIADAYGRDQIGKTIDVLIDEVDEDGATGRSKADAPEIDGNVFIDDMTLKPGDLVKAKVIEGEGVDLWAETIR